MATVVRELHPSAEPRDLQDSRTAARHFVVYDNATPGNFADEQDVLNIFGNGTMPDYGEAHPSIAGLVAIDFANLRPDPSSANVWNISWNYLRTSASSGTSPGTPGYWEYQYRASATTEEAWRENSPDASGPQLVFPANGIPAFTNGSPNDVGGVSIDSAGEPGSTIRAVQVVEITRHVEGQHTPAAAFALLRKRNQSTFLGAQPGRLAYTGISASARLDTNLFSISQAIVWDEWYHMRQIVARGSNGEPYRKAYAGTNIGVPWVAEYVYWTQPLPKLASFSGIIP